MNRGRKGTVRSSVPAAEGPGVWHAFSLTPRPQLLGPKVKCEGQGGGRSFLDPIVLPAALLGRMEDPFSNHYHSAVPGGEGERWLL